MQSSNPKPYIAILSGSPRGGGITKFVINLSKALISSGFKVDLIVPKMAVQLSEQLPITLRIIDLGLDIQYRMRDSIQLTFSLVKYLRKNQPNFLLSNLPLINFSPVFANLIAQTRTKIILTEHISPFGSSLERSLRNPIALTSMKLGYRMADKVIFVSQSLCNEFQRFIPLPHSQIEVIYNPVVDFEEIDKVDLEVQPHYFFEVNSPIFLAVGRLAKEKDFLTLIKAFDLLRKSQEAKLLILGEGPERKSLEALIQKLDRADDVMLLGQVSPPYAYMRRANALVLTSRREGLPTVIIEALACGCNVISTDCPHGPREILVDGEYGWLTPLEDIPAIAEAMKIAIQSPMEAKKLKERARDFSVSKSVKAYQDLFSVAETRPE